VVGTAFSIKQNDGGGRIETAVTTPIGVEGNKVSNREDVAVRGKRNHTIRPQRKKPVKSKGEDREGGNQGTELVLLLEA